MVKCTKDTRRKITREHMLLLHYSILITTFITTRTGREGAIVFQKNLDHFYEDDPVITINNLY